MPVLRIVRKRNYTVIPNNVIRDKSLSLQAKMILITYLSNKEGIEVSNEYIQTTCKNGRESIATAVNELIEAGYYRRDKVQAGHGYWHTIITITTDPWQFDDDQETMEGQVDRGDNMTPLDTPPGAGFPAVGAPTVGAPAPKRVSTREKQPFLTSRRGAPSSPENEDSIQRVSTEPRPPRKRSGMRRVVLAEEGPDTGRMVGKRGTTEKAIRTHEARRAISRPNSGGGLAEEFGQRASEAGLSGPQEINGQALARNLTRWMHESNNPDSPDDIRAMMDEFFERPGGSEDYPLWRRFLSEAPKLRNTRRKTEPYDYQAAAERDRKWIEKAAASGDVRAQMELSGENRPWLKSS